MTFSLLDPRGNLKGAAARAAGLWTGPVTLFSAESLDGAGIVIDAIFGAGLSRPLDGEALVLVEFAERTSDTHLRDRYPERA